MNTVCQLTGTAPQDIKPELVLTWLSDPFGNQEYVIIVFYDDDTKQSFAAHYNKRRLLDAKANSSRGGEQDCHPILGMGS